MTDLSPDAKALLRKARADFSPGENRLAKVRGALEARMAVSGADVGASKTAPRGTGAPAAPAISAPSWTVAHSIGTAVLIGALGAAGLAMWRTRTSNVAMTHVQPISERVLAAPSPKNEPTKEEKPAGNGTPLLAETAASRATPFVDSSGDPRMSRVQGAGDPVGRAQGRPRSKTDVPRETPVDPPVVAPPTAVIAPVTPPPAAEAVDSLAEEVRLLRDARAALDRADPSRALGFLDVHASRFPRGTLYEERLATRVLAFCALGRIDDARLAARELERAAPRSPHLGRVRASCIAATASP
jgi:hypothetical protein